MVCREGQAGEGAIALARRDFHAEFKKTFSTLMNRHQGHRAFSDFCEMSATAYSNAIFVDPEREARYLKIVEAYDKEEIDAMVKLLATTVLALEDDPMDFLGEMFMALEMSNAWHGQFFTPMSISKAMAAMTIDGIGEKIKEQGFVTLCEPACGAGSTIIGMCAAMKDAGMNYQQDMHVTAIDLDPTAAHMCFIQLSLLHVPALVYVGNTLSLKMQSVWATPAHLMGFWDFKLKRLIGTHDKEEVFKVAAREKADGKAEQLGLALGA